MSLQALIDDLRDRAKNAHGKQVDIYIEPGELIKLCDAAAIMYNELKFISRGENRPGQHMQWANFASGKADSIARGEK